MYIECDNSSSLTFHLYFFVMCNKVRANQCPTVNLPHVPQTVLNALPKLILSKGQAHGCVFTALWSEWAPYCNDKHTVCIANYTQFVYIAN